MIGEESTWTVKILQDRRKMYKSGENLQGWTQIYKTEEEHRRKEKKLQVWRKFLKNRGESTIL